MAAKFRRVAVLKGGPSEEREVSLRSGAAVAKALRETGREVLEIDVTAEALPDLGGAEAVFIALHGRFGEDGGVQRLLERRRIPYTGPGPEASRVCMDKKLTRAVLAAAGLPVAPGVVLASETPEAPLPLPVVVKPTRQGSSVGCHRVSAPAEWGPSVRDALRYDGEAVVETFIEGRELTVGVLGGQPLPVVEVRAPGGNYCFTAKYTPGMTEYLVPAPLAADETAAVQRLGAEVFRALGCRGMGRVDLRRAPDGRPFVLELNSIPGFTQTSLFPKAAAAAGMDFVRLCDCVLNLAALDG